MTKKGFTLLELLIVIGILAILATVTIVVLNPAQMLAEARDSQRLSDLSSIQSAVGLYLTTATSTAVTAAGPFATASTTCGFTTCTIPAFPYGVDGTGWVGIDLRATSGGSAIAVLPKDPTNADLGANGVFQYSYKGDTNNKTFELDTRLESNKYKVKMTQDGGNQNTCPTYLENTCWYEVGTYPGLNI